MPPFGAKLAGALGVVLWAHRDRGRPAHPVQLVPEVGDDRNAQPFFEWMNDLAVSKAIGESIWIYPLVQAIHLVFLALFAGALLIVDLRLLGFGMREQPVARSPATRGPG